MICSHQSIFRVFVTVKHYISAGFHQVCIHLVHGKAKARSLLQAGMGICMITPRNTVTFRQTIPRQRCADNSNVLSITARDTNWVSLNSALTCKEHHASTKHRSNTTVGEMSSNHIHQHMFGTCLSQQQRAHKGMQLGLQSG